MNSANKNSVRQELTLSSKTAEVVLLLRAPGLEKKALVLVEGPDDVKFYAKLFNEQCSALHAIGGCIQMDKILEDCNIQYENKILAMKDADFDHLNNISYSPKNLFLTDTHDVETMIITEKCVANLCYEHLTKNELDLLTIVLEELKPLSFLKWYNSEKKLKLNFDTISLSIVYKGATTNVNDWLAELYRNKANKNKLQITEADITGFMSTNANVNIYHLVNGHDLCHFLMLKLTSLGAKNIAKDLIPKYLRMNYTIESFSGTNMYNKINAWGVSNSYCFFVA